MREYWSLWASHLIIFATPSLTFTQGLNPKPQGSSANPLACKLQNGESNFGFTTAHIISGLSLQILLLAVTPLNPEA